MFICAALLFPACTLEKRHYRNGFYVEWNQALFPHQKILPRDTTDEHRVVAEQNVPAYNREEPALAVEFPQPEKRADIILTEHHSTVSVPESTHRRDIPAADPQPEAHDKINPVVSGLIGTGMVFSMAWYVLLHSMIIAGGAVPFFIILPFIGVLLFVVAMFLRERYALRKAQGEAVQLSAHYHRFRLLLFLFFGSALMLSVGWAFALGGSTVYGLGLLGVILGGGGMMLLQGLTLVLLALFLFYLFVWRKDPTGVKKRRDRHPAKEP